MPTLIRFFQERRAFERSLFNAMTQQTKGGDATRHVLRFTFRHWRAEPRYVALIVVTMMASTLADVFMPVFAGRLVDAIAAGGADREAALHAALVAFGFMTGLGLVTIVMRHLAYYGIVELTLRVMGRVAQDAFARVQRLESRAERIEALPDLETQVQAARQQDFQSSGAFIPFRRTH